MKKLVCVLLSAVLLLAGFSVLTGAQETPAEEVPVEKTINDHLTAWWNFNGETEKEQLRDKAPAGKTADNLYRISAVANNIAIAGGICDIKPDADTALWLDMTEGTSDVRLTENTTLFIKFRFSGANTGHADILQMEGLYRIFRHANGDLRITLDSVKDSNKSAVTLISSDVINPDQDIYFALVSDADLEAKTFKATIYLSTDGETYQKTEFFYENMSLAFGGGRSQANANGMFIGNHRLKKDHGLDYQFDDIRIYDKSFTDAEVAQITKLETTEAPEVIPEATTEDPNVTTAEPKPELPKDGTINDYLISWWNFEGADITEQMQDKAVRGANQDDLEIKGSVTVENGVAYVSKDEGNGLFAARSEDLIGVESMTVYAKLKYTGSHQDWPDAIYYDGLYRYFNYQYDATYADTSLRACFFGNQYLLASGNQPQDTWYYVILTTELDTEASQMTFSVSVSADGIVWVTSSLSKNLDIATLSAIKIKQKAESAGLCLGKASRWLDRGVGYYFDDVRIYGKALSTNEFALIQENTTDLRDPAQLPGQNVTTEPVISETNPAEPSITTERPVLTAAPRTQATPTAEKTPATDPVTNQPANQEKKGCGASVTVGLALIVGVSGIAALAVRKKDD